MRGDRRSKSKIEAAQEKQREHYNHKHANPEAFLVGSKVFVKDFSRRKRQMDLRWLAHYTIEKNLHIFFNVMLVNLQSG